MAVSIKVKRSGDGIEVAIDGEKVLIPRDRVSDVVNHINGCYSHLLESEAEIPPVVRERLKIGALLRCMV